MPLTADQERLALSYDPFAGDFGSQGDKIFSDRMVTAAKDRPSGACCICFGSIAKGERHRVQKAVIDGDFKQCRMCGECCLAMAIQGIDCGDAIELRTELGMRRMGAMGRTPEPNLTDAEFFAQKSRERTADAEFFEQKSRERTAQLGESFNKLGAAAGGATEKIDRLSDALGDISTPPEGHSLKWFWVSIGTLALVAAIYVMIAASHGR